MARLTYVRMLVLWSAAAITGACIALWFSGISGTGVLWIGGGLGLSIMATIWCILGKLSDQPSQTDSWHTPLETEKFDRYCEAFPLAAIVLNGDGRIVSCNLRAQKTFGLGRQEIVDGEFNIANDGKVTEVPSRDNINTNENSDLLLDNQQCYIAGKYICTGDILKVPLRGNNQEKSPTLVLVKVKEDQNRPPSVPSAIEAPLDLRLHDDDRLLLRELNYDLRTRFQSASGVLDLAENTENHLNDHGRFQTLQQIYRDAVGRLDTLLSFLEMDEKNVQKNTVTFGLDDFLNDVSFSLSQSHDIDNNEILFDADHSAGTAITLNRELLVKLVCHIVFHIVAGEQGKTILIGVRLERLEDGTSKINIEVLTEQPDTGHRNSEIFLDLEIARRIATQLGGHLYTDHKYQNSTGIAFTCALENVDTFERGLTVPAHLKNLRVLIADDNETSRKAFQQLASSIGWNADVAASGEAALHMIRFKQGMREPYDVFLVDWRMEGLDGWETSKQVRDMQEGGATPIIVMISAHNRSFLSKNIEDRGRVLNGFLTKPVTLTMLLDAVADATAHMHDPAFYEADNRVDDASLANRTVLIVDDNQIHREVACEFLTRNGAKVLTATGGYDAISVVQKNSDIIDVILMDVQMPDLNGFDTVKRIRELGFTDITILMMTANNTAELHRRSLEVGACNVVIKPFVMRELVNAMSMHLLRRKSSENAAAAPPAVAELPTGML